MAKSMRETIEDMYQKEKMVFQKKMEMNRMKKNHLISFYIVPMNF